MTSLKELYTSSATLGREGNMNELFYTQGSVDAVNVRENHSTTELDIFPQKCYRDYRERRFAAQCCTLPLCSPNKVATESYKLDPCIGMVMARREKLARFHTSVVSNHYLWKGYVSDENETALQDIVGPGSSLRSVSEHTKTLAKDLEEEWNSNTIATHANSAYTGGCMTYQQIGPNEDLAGVLMYPSGENMDTLVATQIDSGIKLNSQNRTSFQCTSRILQLDSVKLDDSVICAVRTFNNVCIILKLHNNHGVFDFSQLSEFSMKSCSMTSIHLSPYIPGELLTTFEDGTVYLCRDNQHESVFRSSGPRFACDEMWWSAQFGAHPRQILMADRTGIAIWDARAKASCKNDLLALPHKYLHTKERVMVTKAYKTNSFYHIVATNHQLFLQDQRFLNMPVLQWDHLLEHPPQYIDVSCGVITPDSDDVIILGSQLSSEIHCFQFNLNTAENPPQIKAPLWKVSKPGDFAVIGHSSGLHVPVSVLNQRLKRAQIGIAAVQNDSVKDAFTVSQVTSIGDIFYQQFTMVPHAKDITWSLGPGSNRLNISKDVRDVCEKWVTEAEVIEEQARQIWPTYMADISEMHEELHSATGASISCALCKPVAPSPAECSGEVVGPDRCESCRLSRNSSIKLAECYKAEADKSIYSEESTVDPMVRIRNFTPDINPASHKDGSSQLLYAQWKGKSGKDLLPLLKKREKENSERIKARMRKKLTKKGMDTTIFEDADDQQDDEVDQGIASDAGASDVSETEEPHVSSQSTKVCDEDGLLVEMVYTPGQRQLEPITEKGHDEDDRLSVVSEVSSLGSQKSPRRKRRKLTDSVSELKALGGSLSPVPKRVIYEPQGIGVSPPHSSQLSTLPVFSPQGQRSFKSPVSGRKKFKKRKSSGIMGF